jgi:hypothetical protein
MSIEAGLTMAVVDITDMQTSIMVVDTIMVGFIIR